MKRPILLIILVLMTSCSKNDEGLSTSIFEVTTAGISIDCRLVLIVFSESDRERINKLTNTNGLQYEALNLSVVKYGNEGKTLRVKVRKTLDSEYFACTTLGASYPWVTVLEAELKE